MKMLDVVVPFLLEHWESVVIFLFVFILSSWLLDYHRKNRKLPPGPKSFPGLGCLSVLTSPDKRRTFAEMRNKYGDVFSYRLGCRLVVVINGFEMLKEAFVHQSDAFLHRPRVFTVTHIGQGKGIVNASGRVWREHRRFTVNTFRSLGIGTTSFEGKVNEELEALLKVIAFTQGQDFDPSHTLQTAIANIICSIAFGNRFDYEDPLFVKFLQIFDENMKLAGSTAILNFFPWLRFVPGDKFKAALSLKNVSYVQTYLKGWIDNHQKIFDAGNIQDFIDVYLNEIIERDEKMKKKHKTTFSYEQLLKTVGDLLVGGTETTATTLRWFLIFLVRWPNVQKRMREEIDTVCPDYSLINYSDRLHMPYVEAAILECQRFADIAPFSLAHAASRDVTLKNYVVPKGTFVIPNLSSVHQDPVLWENPDAFQPERFLDADGKLNKPDHLIPFSIGKRSCPGEGLARMELFLIIANVLQRYEIKPSKHGKLPTLQGTLGITYTPQEFQVRFVKRAAL